MHQTKNYSSQRAAVALAIAAITVCSTGSAWADDVNFSGDHEAFTITLPCKPEHKTKEDDGVFLDRYSASDGATMYIIESGFIFTGTVDEFARHMESRFSNVRSRSQLSGKGWQARRFLADASSADGTVQTIEIIKADAAPVYYILSVSCPAEDKRARDFFGSFKLDAEKLSSEQAYTTGRSVGRWVGIALIVAIGLGLLLLVVGVPVAIVVL